MQSARLTLPLALVGAALALGVGPGAAPPARAQACVFDDLVCEGDVLVTDVLSDALLRVTRGQQPIAPIAGSPRGVAVDTSGFPFVSESVANEILRVNPESGGTLEIISSPQFDSDAPWVVPEEVLVEPSGTLLVVEPFASAAYRLDPVTGAIGFAFSSGFFFPDPNAQPSFPEGMALDPDDPNRLYFADADSVLPTLWLADLASGEIMAVAQLGALVNPHDVVVFRTGAATRRLLLSDPEAQAIFVFDPPASFDPDATPIVPDASHRLLAAPDVGYPLGLATLDEDGDGVDDGFVVADFDQSAVLRFSSDANTATLDTTYSGGSLDGPWGVAVVGELAENARSDFAVVDTGANTLYRVEVDPAEPTEGVRQNLSQDMSFQTPAGVATLPPALGGEARYGVTDGGSASSCADPALIEVVDDGAVPGGGSQSDICPDVGLGDPRRVAVIDTDGDGAVDEFLVADPEQRSVFRIEPDGSQTTLVEFEEPLAPVALALDRDGVLLVLNRHDDFQGTPPEYDALVRVSLTSGCKQTTFFSTVVDPADVAIDPVNGEALVADRRSTQFELNEQLSGVLRVDPRTGVIGTKRYGPFLDRDVQGIAVDANRELLVTTREAPCDPEADPGCNETPPPPEVLRVNTTANDIRVVSVGPETTLAAAQPAGVTDLDVVDTAGFAAGDPVRIRLDDGTLLPTSVDSVPTPGAPGVIRVTDALPSAAAAGNLVLEVVWSAPDGIAIEPSILPVLDDVDGDAVGDSEDNCLPGAPGQGPCACEDFFPDPDCPGSTCPDACFNPLQRDTNEDGFGDVCQPDDPDHDGIPADGDGSGTAGDLPCPGLVTLSCDDNCPDDANPNQSDLNQDGFGDVCQDSETGDDPDGDGIPSDGDGNGTPGDNPCPDLETLACDDSCPDDANPAQSDQDQDGLGDACDDSDGDGLTDDSDNCPNDSNKNQENNDGDVLGDVCDPDDDDDGFLDFEDNCVFLANDQTDSNADGCGDACDPLGLADFNGDGVISTGDFFLWRAEFKASCTGAACQADADGDDVVSTADFLSWRTEFKTNPTPGPTGLTPQDPFCSDP